MKVLTNHGDKSETSLRGLQPAERQAASYKRLTRSRLRYLLQPWFDGVDRVHDCSLGHPGSCACKGMRHKGLRSMIGVPWALVSMVRR